MLMLCIGPIIHLAEGAAPDADVTLPAQIGNITAPLDLQAGQTISNLFGAKDSLRYFTIAVPPGQFNLIITMDGGDGDADLYLRQTNQPSLREYDYRPFVLGNTEDIKIEQPAEGVYHLLIHGYASYTGVTLNASMTPLLPPPERNYADLPHDMELALYYELSDLPTREERWTAELRAHALRQEGWNAFNAGNFTDAVKIWTQWHELEPESVEPLSLIGDVYLFTDDIEKAMQYYRRSLQVYPGQIELAMRNARLLDTAAGKPEAARDLLNFYARIFPNNSMVTLAQAAWLVRRHRHDEARALTKQVIDGGMDKSDADKMQALALLHDLLPSMRERFDNLRAMLVTAERPGMASALASNIREHDLLSHPESWMLLNFIAQEAERATTPEQRCFFTDFLPRQTPAIEEFRHGRMSQDWAASKDGNLFQHGRLILNTAVKQSEVSLRLTRSESMPNGFIEAVVESSRGFFWMYARRGSGNMIRFGFDENNRIYLQNWLNGQLLANYTRVRQCRQGAVRMRLDLRGDGAVAFIDDAPAFNSPLSIPYDMGLGWWGFAPWSQQPGAAGAVIRGLKGGPLPVRIGIPPTAQDEDGQGKLSAERIRQLKSRMHELSALAPAWYCQNTNGSIDRIKTDGDMDCRLLCRYYRVRLLPSVATDHPDRLNFDELIELACADRADGLTILVQKMPNPEWLAAAEQALLNTTLTLMIVMQDENKPSAQVREICAHVGLFPAPRRTHILPVIAPPAPSAKAEEFVPIDYEAPNAILLL